MDFLQHFVTKHLGMLIGGIVAAPLLMLPIAPGVWLLMVLIGVSPMSWRGLLANWAIITVLFDIAIVYGIVAGSWQDFQSRNRG